MGWVGSEFASTTPARVVAPALRERAWIAVLVLGLAVTAAYFVAPASQQEGWYVGVGAASVVAMAVGVRVHRPTRPAGWYLLAAANFCFVAGDEASNVYTALTGRDVPTPSFSDALYLAGYPFMIVAVYLLARSAGFAATREHRIDAALISVGVLATGWQPLVEPAAGDTSVSLFGRLVTASYPVMDVGVLFIVVGAVISARASTVSQRLVALSIAVMLVADVVYLFATMRGTYANGDPVDAGWLLSYVLFAVAALHPSMAASTTPVPASDHLHPRRWLVVVSIASFLPLALLLLRAVRHHDLEFAAPVLFSIAAFAFVGVRVVLLFGRVGRQSRELAAQAESLQAALDARQALEADLRHRAFHDDLTDLPNRAWIRDRLDAALAGAAGCGRVAFCLADLDRFKAVNDTLGHRAGDAVLVEVARRLRELAGDGVIVGRLGGDEFACVLSGADEARATRAAQRIVDALSEPLEVDGRRIQLSGSVGLAMGDRTTSGATLLTQADTAMYAAKARGRNGWRRYEPSMGELLAEQLAITSAFSDALERDEFTVVYQPVFTVDCGRLKGFESLVRWDHPSLGPISPARFVPLAEETGFVVALGRWVLTTACHAAASWSGTPTVAVNVSARQLADPGLVADVAAALAGSGLASSRLVLEVTESAIMDDVEQATRTVEELKALGVVIAIDDFGTGHSSLAQLRDLPIDVLKIDRSFVSPLDGTTGCATSYVEAIVGLAHALGMSTVAEGVESQIQYDALRALGCDTVQGYLTGRPLDPGAADALAATAATAARPTLDAVVSAG